MIIQPIDEDTVLVKNTPNEEGFFIRMQNKDIIEVIATGDIVTDRFDHKENNTTIMVISYKQYGNK